MACDETHTNTEFSLASDALTIELEINRNSSTIGIVTQRKIKIYNPTGNLETGKIII